jgi:phage baseplate assembly protein W
MRYLTAYRRNILGYGLVQPMRRLASSDFVAAEGEALIRACIRQILGTKPGELRWNPAFGTAIEPYRHRNNTPMLSKALGDMIASALQEWEPRVKLAACSAQITGNQIDIRVGWVVTASESATDNNVIIGPISQEVSV